MKDQAISVTEASRNFAECVSRAYYQGASFVLKKNGVAMARIVPKISKPTSGPELAKALGDALKDFHLDAEEATTWLHDLEETRRTLARPTSKWQS